MLRLPHTTASSYGLASPQRGTPRQLGVVLAAALAATVILSVAPSRGMARAAEGSDLGAPERATTGPGRQSPSKTSDTLREAEALQVRGEPLAAQLLYCQEASALLSVHPSPPRPDAGAQGTDGYATPTLRQWARVAYALEQACRLAREVGPSPELTSLLGVVHDHPRCPPFLAARARDLDAALAALAGEAIPPSLERNGYAIAWRWRPRPASDAGDPCWIDALSGRGLATATGVDESPTPPFSAAPHTGNGVEPTRPLPPWRSHRSGDPLRAIHPAHWLAIAATRPSRAEASRSLVSPSDQAGANAGRPASRAGAGADGTARDGSDGSDGNDGCALGAGTDVDPEQVALVYLTGRLTGPKAVPSAPPARASRNSPSAPALLLGGHADVAIWLNGDPLAGDDPASESGALRIRGGAPDGVAVALPVRPGANQLLLATRAPSSAKAARPGKDEPPWRLWVRVVDGEGQPLPPPVPTASPPTASARELDADALRRPPSSVPHSRGASSAEDACVAVLISEAESGAAEACHELAALLLARGPNPERRDLARKLLLRATRLAPDRPLSYVLLAEAARLPEHHWLDREEPLVQAALRAGWRLQAGRPVLGAEIARGILARGGSDRAALDWLARARADHSAAAPPALLAATIHTREHRDAMALALLQELLRRHPRLRSARLLRARLYLRRGDPRRALRDFEAIQAERSLDPRLVEAYAATALEAGRGQDGLAALERFVDRWPDHTPMRALCDRLRHRSVAPRRSLADPDQGGKPGRTAAEHAMLHAMLTPIPDLAAFAEARRAQIAQLLRSTEAGGGTEAREQAEDRDPPETVVLLWEDVTRLDSPYNSVRVLQYVVQPRTKGAALAWRRRLAAAPDQDWLSLTAEVLPGNGRSGWGPMPIDLHAGRGGAAAIGPLRSGDVLRVVATLRRRQGYPFESALRFRLDAPCLVRRYVLLHPRAQPLSAHGSHGILREPAPGNGAALPGAWVADAWRAVMLPAAVDEPFAPPVAEREPVLYLSTHRDWDALARWYWLRVRDRQAAGAGVRRLADRLRGVAPGSARLEALSTYVTTAIRYQSLPLGEYGYTPYRAETVLARGFGDCKDMAALFNTTALELGWDAWPALLRLPDAASTIGAAGGKRGAMRLGPAPPPVPMLGYFNHCVSRVTLGRDAAWLDGADWIAPTAPSPPRPKPSEGSTESTSARSASAAAERPRLQALLITPTGGRWLPVTLARARDVTWREAVRLDMDGQGGGMVEMTVSGGGAAARALRAGFPRPEAWDPAMMRLARARLASPTTTVRAATATRTTAQNAPAKTPPHAGPAELLAQAQAWETVLARVALVGRAAPHAGETTVADASDATYPLPTPRLWFSSAAEDALLPARFADFAPTPRRRLPLRLPRAWVIEREIEWTWPDPWRLREHPRDLDLEHPFGRLIVTYHATANSLRVQWRLRLGAINIPPSRYPAFRDLCALADLTAAFQPVLIQPAGSLEDAP